MYIVFESGRDTNLPVRYIAHSPAIAQHNANLLNSRSQTSAKRFKEPSILGEYSLNHVAFPAESCNSSWASVKPVLPLKYSLFREDINLNYKTNNYFKKQLYPFNRYYILRLY